MHRRVKPLQIKQLEEAILAVMRSGWDKDLDVLWDLREKIPQFEKLGRLKLEASRHQKNFDDDCEYKAFTTYLLRR